MAGRPILPKSTPEDEKSYMDVDVIKAAFHLMIDVEKKTQEFDVGRVLLSILISYFPMEDNWVIVPEVQVPEKKRPDFCIEKFSGREFLPKIFVEIKSAKGKNFVAALEQLTSSLSQTIGEIEQDFSCFLILAKGRRICFFEYHNDRSNLTEDGYLHYHGAVPFNHPLTIPEGRVPILPSETQKPYRGLSKGLPPERPRYTGVGKFPHRDEYKGDEIETMAGRGYILDLDADRNTVRDVLKWMSTNSPLSYE